MWFSDIKILVAKIFKFPLSWLVTVIVRSSSFILYLLIHIQEQELYERESLGVNTVTYVDNQDCIGESLLLHYTIDLSDLDVI